jgi:hypothetical protein
MEIQICPQKRRASEMWRIGVNISIFSLPSLSKITN